MIQLPILGRVVLPAEGRSTPVRALLYALLSVYGIAVGLFPWALLAGLVWVWLQTL